jgi:hypothetical protein
MTTLRTQFLNFDDRLAKLAVPPLTPWWRAGIGEWLDAYERGHVLELVACVGRGSAKSTALYKLATFFTLFGAFIVPPGERHFAIVLSRLKEEASKGIDIIASWLGLLGVAHRPSGDVIELVDKPRGIRVVAASVAAASGWRAYFVGKDERSKWPASGVEEREAEEIDTSAGAMTATHALAPVLSFGSAWGAFGSFYEAVRTGTDAHRVVLGPTPTWVAAPHISEDSTRRKERDACKWAREYACVFQESTEESLYPVSLIDRAMRVELGDIGPGDATEYAAAMDPSLGRNAWTLAIAARRSVNGRAKASIVLAREWRKPVGQHFDMAGMIGEIAGLVAPYTSEVVTDQFHGESLQAIAQRLRLDVSIIVDKPTAAERLERYESLLTRLSDDEIELPNDRRVRADLLSVKRKFTPAGFGIHLPTTSDGRHTDYAPSIVLAIARIEALPGWAEAMDALERRGYVFADAETIASADADATASTGPVEVSTSVYGGACVATVQGLRGEAHFEPSSDRQSVFSHDAEPAFRARIMKWWATPNHHGIRPRDGSVPGDKPTRYPSYCAICQSHVIGICPKHKRPDEVA